MNQATPLCTTFTDLDGLSKDFCSNLLFDEVTRDVELCVQDERLAAHRAILASRSQVFKAMFFGPMLESAAKVVEISTFAPGTMRLLLRFIYTGCVEQVNLEEMVPLMACADHYGVSALSDRIGCHLQDSISPETACTVLALARAYKQDHIQERYLNFILTHAQQVMLTEGFLNLDEAVLMKVLEADEARIEEIDLFKALVRWYRHWARAPEARPQEKQQAARLFGAIRYSQMSGPQLVKEVKPLAGKIVPQDLYVRALEQVAAPASTHEEDCTNPKQSVRRQPPLGRIQTSDPLMLAVHSTFVKKVGPNGWNCSAVIDPTTSRTCFRVEHLSDMQNGIGVAIFDPERNALQGGSSGFPNPNQWGAGSWMLLGIYGTGCFFGIITDHVLRWHPGLTVEVAMTPERSGSLHVTFTAEGVEGERLVAEGMLSGTHGVKLAVALYSREDKVSVESRW